MIGGGIAGIFVMSVWGEFADSYGIAGGWFAAMIIIGTMWFLNHYIGIIHNSDYGAWVDMGLAIGVCGISRDLFLSKSFYPLLQSSPTIIVVVLGGIGGGIAATAVQKTLENKSKKTTQGLK